MTTANNDIGSQAFLGIRTLSNVAFGIAGAVVKTIAPATGILSPAIRAGLVLESAALGVGISRLGSATEGPQLAAITSLAELSTGIVAGYAVKGAVGLGAVAPEGIAAPIIAAAVASLIVGEYLHYEYNNSDSFKASVDLAYAGLQSAKDYTSAIVSDLSGAISISVGNLSSNIYSALTSPSGSGPSLTDLASAFYTDFSQSFSNNLPSFSEALPRLSSMINTLTDYLANPEAFYPTLFPGSAPVSGYADPANLTL